ncbi:MAG: sugar-binding protein, partial [Bythopirellula sp.]
MRVNRTIPWLRCNAVAALLLSGSLTGECNAKTGPSTEAIRAVVPRASQPVKIDGKLDEYENAFAAPIEYFHPDVKNRPGQFFFLWDDEAFYVGLRTLDEHRYSQEHPLWEGDAVEWYFDTRRNKQFLNRKWGQGSVHCFFTPMHLDQIKPRFCLRPGYEDAIPEIGIEVAAQATDSGLAVEFKLPWENFPDFQPKVGEVIGVDAELSYSDGGPRSDRSFVFGNPLSVWQPANQARVQLVEKFEPMHWQMCGPIMMPMRVDIPWSQETRPRVKAMVAMPPHRTDEIGKVLFQVLDLHGEVIGEYEATEEEALADSTTFLRKVTS